MFLSSSVSSSRRRRSFSGIVGRILVLVAAISAAAAATVVIVLVDTIRRSKTNILQGQCGGQTGQARTHNGNATSWCWLR